MPKPQILSLEEIAQIARSFVAMGVTKIRITGGEPLVRQNVIGLMQELGQLPGLEQLVMTTNGARLVEHATALREAGVSRLNISLDTLNPDRFRELTRTGELEAVLKGIEAAKAAGFERIKLNAVILKGRNLDEVKALVDYAVAQGIDIAFIEEMPLGHISEHQRNETFVDSATLREQLSRDYQLSESSYQSQGPARYFSLRDRQGQPLDSQVGFISPHSDNFCASCNRVRLTAEGRLLLCLGNEHSVDLREVVRQHPNDDERLREAIIAAIGRKPERHHFDLDAEPTVLRFMNATGG